MKAVYALYPKPTSAQRAVDALRRTALGRWLARARRTEALAWWMWSAGLLAYAARLVGEAGQGGKQRRHGRAHAGLRVAAIEPEGSGHPPDHVRRDRRDASDAQVVHCTGARVHTRRNDSAAGK